MLQARETQVDQAAEPVASGELGDPPLRLLLVEDSSLDAVIAETMLADHWTGPIEQRRVTTLAEAERVIAEWAPTCVLLDLGLPDADGLKGLDRLVALQLGIPIVVFSASEEETAARLAVQRGAQDYLVKGRVDGELLARSVRYALDRVQVLEFLSESEERFRSLFANAPVGQACVSLDGFYLEVNPSFARMLGYEVDEIVGLHVDAITHPDDRAATRTAIDALVDGSRASVQFEKRYVRKDGGPALGRVSASLTRDSAGAPVLLVGLIEDITAQRTTEAALRETQDRLRMVVSNLPMMLVAFDDNGVCTFAEGSALASHGLAADELVGQSLLARHQTPRLRDGVRRALMGLDSDVTVKVGDTVWDVSHRPLRDTTAAVVGGIEVSTDVTERVAAQDGLTHLELHDALTDLPNRSLFIDRLNRSLTRSERMASSVAVLLLDVARLKNINDSLGHAAGDLVLTEISRRLESAVRPRDTVARMGGDEFAICCDEFGDEHSAIALAERILQRLREPFDVGGRNLHVSGSIGIALSENAASAEDLLRDANLALNDAKLRGRGRYRVYREAEGQRALERLDLEHALRDAIEGDQLVLYYQPELALTDASVTGVEALVRWQHPERGLVPPLDFISLAEETGLIVPLGNWVLREACRQAVRWQETFPEQTLMFSVNLSARQLDQPDLVDVVASALQDAGLQPDRLCLELTESVLMEEAEVTVQTLHRLKELGVRLAVDDFGTGYSSLLYLKRFPVDVLKIDRSFIAGLGQDAEDSTIVRAVVSLAHAMGLQAIAEGVETIEQLNELRVLRCDLAQGFHWSRPLPPSELLEWLRTYSAPGTQPRSAGTGG
ncbi:MAG TPA: EAL domain-containing protein [Egibacteraceae bacterium]|nr:EAL domain-containing protein [Egibacteraceae bacterium]